jgi:iron complex outermembrane receptor protein
MVINLITSNRFSRRYNRNKINGDLVMAIKHRIYFAAIIALFFLNFNSFMHAAGNTAIIGTVKDETLGEALWGASILVLGTSYGSSTDFDGNYIIQNLPAGTYTLRISYIGYQRQEKTVEVVQGKTIRLDFIRSY